MYCYFISGFLKTLKGTDCEINIPFHMIWGSFNKKRSLKLIKLLQHKWWKKRWTPWGISSFQIYKNILVSEREENNACISDCSDIFIGIGAKSYSRKNFRSQYNFDFKSGCLRKIKFTPFRVGEKEFDFSRPLFFTWSYLFFLRDQQTIFDILLCSNRCKWVRVLVIDQSRNHCK